MSSKYRRKSGIRRDHLHVIAAEGYRTEVTYIRGIQQELRNSRIKLEVIERDEKDAGLSTWADVVSMLDSAKKKKEYRSNDEFYVLVDRDEKSNKLKNITQVAAECRKKKYQLIVSNPSIEFWFLLHYRSPDEISEDEKNAILANKNGYLKTLVRQVVGKYNAVQVDINDFFPHTAVAIQRAEALDENKEHEWPEQMGSRMYRLLSRLLELDRE